MPGKSVNMKKALKIDTIIFTALMLYVIAGCEPELSKHYSLKRQDEYQHIAIICVPKSDAGPDYTNQILKEVENNTKNHLGFLKKVDCFSGIPVDMVSTLPKVDLGNFTGYDAVLCLAYSYEFDEAYLDFYMLDTKTTKCIWYHQFASADVDPGAKLVEYGKWVPVAVKIAFYGL